MDFEFEGAEQQGDGPSAGEDEEASFLNRLLDSAMEYVDAGQDETQLMSERQRAMNQEFTTPYNKDIIENAVKVLVQAERERIAEETDRDPRTIKGVEFDIKTPREVVFDFGLALEVLHDDLVDRIDERNGDEQVNPIMDVHPPTMAQIVGEPQIGKSGDITILHGARNIIYNLCEDLGYNDHERKLVQLTHRIAARRNGLHRFVLVNDVVVIDTGLSQKLGYDEIREGGSSQGRSDDLFQEEEEGEDDFFEDDF